MIKIKIGKIMMWISKWLKKVWTAEISTFKILKRIMKIY